MYYITYFDFGRQVNINKKNKIINNLDFKTFQNYLRDIFSKNQFSINILIWIIYYMLMYFDVSKCE